MFDFSNAKLNICSIYRMSESSDQDSFNASIVELRDHEKEALLNYALHPFLETEEYLCFSSYDENTPNALKQIIDLYFTRNEDWQSTTQRISSHLEQCTHHPNIKIGDLLFMHIDHIGYDDQVIDAVGLFKCESLSEFLSITIEDQINIDITEGYNLGKMDKGAIIFNVKSEEGNIVCVKDTTPGFIARYWKDEFLRISPINESYNQTAAYMNMAQTYVKHQLVEDIEMPKSEQLSMLHDTGKYFKENNTFVEKDYEAQVFHNNPDIISSFKQYKGSYSNQLNQHLPSEFSVSGLAVKRSAKDFKSVLKLDKNFHVYIHGNRQMIEHGVDSQGRKFYKLYYEQER